MAGRPAGRGTLANLNVTQLDDRHADLSEMKWQKSKPNSEADASSSQPIIITTSVEPIATKESCCCCRCRCCCPPLLHESIPNENAFVVLIFFCHGWSLFFLDSRPFFHSPTYANGCVSDSVCVYVGQARDRINLGREEDDGNLFSGGLCFLCRNRQ